MAKSYKTLYDNIDRFGDVVLRREADVKDLCAGKMLEFNPLLSDLDPLRSSNDVYEWLTIQSRQKELQRQLRQIDIAINKIKTATTLIKLQVNLQKKIPKEMSYEKFDACVYEDKKALQFLFTQTSTLGQYIKDYTPNITSAVVRFRDEFGKVSTEDETNYTNRSTSWIIRNINEGRVRFVELGYEGLKLKADKVMQYTQQASVLMEAEARGIIASNGAANDLWVQNSIAERVSQSAKMVNELFIGRVTLKHFLVASNAADPRTGKAAKTEPQNYNPASILPFAQKPA